MFGKKKDLSEEEQMKFYTKVAEYISKHPEFVEELEERIEAEENPDVKQNEEKKDLSYFMKKGFKNLKEEDINAISGEISGILFNRKKEESSLLEKTLQNAASSLVSNYLSSYLGKK